ncbi:MAG: hypothetical protein B7O98_06725 [Zestosphaera tikiterensis]|uniref:Phosphoribosyltransferase domain-containing protein n=1 Tax=Zestosphaera tikiterensis TaxID=1973259 RepID=A0A2R7Y4R0_9CREN|nr:MAG: hypothetical protein B7O98_06725 [Zestosphaera tikiterensis]
MGFLTPSWKEIHLDVVKLAQAITANGYTPESVVGILRGGYLIARMLTDMLNIEDIGVVEVKFYKGIGERAERPIITQPLTTDVKGKNVLIVDDVADSGRTLEVVSEQVRLRGARSVKSAVLYYKPKSIIKPDFIIHVTEDWVIFPWEWCEFLRSFNFLKKGLNLSEVKQELHKMNVLIDDDILQEVLKLHK